MHSSVGPFDCVRFPRAYFYVCACVCGQKGDGFKGWQESRAEIKSLNCYIFHLHLLFYGGWGLPRDSACDSWTWGRSASSAIPHRHPAARVPKAPTQLPWWIWLVFVFVVVVCLHPPPFFPSFFHFLAVFGKDGRCVARPLSCQKKTI